MKTTQASSLYQLLKETDENKLNEFKEFISSEDLKLALVNIFEKNKETISDEIVLINLTNLKNNELQNLKEETEKSLLSFYNLNYFPNNTENILKKNLDLAHTLCSLGHTKKGLAKIKKIKNLAASYNLFDVVNTALVYIVGIDQTYRLNPEKAAEIAKETEENIQLLSNLNQYKMLSLQIYSYQNVLDIDIEIIDNFTKHPLLADRTKPKSILACYYYYLALMDLHNIAKRKKERLKVVNSAVAFFKGIVKTNSYFFPRYFFLMERKLHSELLLNDFDELKKSLDTLQQIEIPEKLTKNLTFLIIFDILKLKYNISYYIETDHQKAIELYESKVIPYLDNKKITANDRQNFFYSTFFNYTVKFNKQKEAVELISKYLNYFHKHFKVINPGHRFTLETFICIFISAYNVLNKDEFIDLFQTHLFKVKNKNFNPEEGSYDFTKKMYDLMLTAYDKGSFFNERIYTKYIDIWSYKTDLYQKMICISKHILADEYKAVKKQKWMSNIDINCG